MIPVVGGALGEPTSLVEDAHAAGLVVHPYTFRNENQFMAPELRSSADPNAYGDGLQPAAVRPTSPTAS